MDIRGSFSRLKNKIKHPGSKRKPDRPEADSGGEGPRDPAGSLSQPVHHVVVDGGHDREDKASDADGRRIRLADRLPVPGVLEPVSVQRSNSGQEGIDGGVDGGEMTLQRRLDLHSKVVCNAHPAGEGPIGANLPSANTIVIAMHHHALGIDEILGEVAGWIVETHPRTAISLACCAKSFEKPALRTLWETNQKDLPTLIKTLPPSCWKVLHSNTSAATLEIALTRTPSKDEWARVQRYASWMRSLGPSYMVIPNNVFQQLSLATSGDPVCPQLQRLVWTSALGWDPSRQFLSPRLVSVVFCHTKDIRVDLGLDSTISSLPTTYLERLRLTGFPRTAPIHSALSKVVLRLNTCFKEIDAWSSLSDAAWGHLASLPKLKSLSLSNTPSIEVLKSVLQEPTFPALERMTLELDGRRPHFPVLFFLLKSSPLKAVTVSGSLRIRHVPSVVAIAVLKTELYRTINALAFTGFHPTDLTFLSRLGPVLSHLGLFSSLRTLVCTTRCQRLPQCVFPLTDSDIERLARGLSQLVTLRLGHKCACSYPNTTIKSMISLSTHCPSLDTLYLPCNLTNISEDVKMESGEPDPRVKTRSSCALEILNLQWMILPKDIEAFEVMKSALCHLFPRLKSP